MAAGWSRDGGRRATGDGDRADETVSEASRPAANARYLPAATAAILALLIALPASAGAGTYRVAACDAAPRAANNSWDASAARGMTAATLCPSRGSTRRGLVVRNLVGAGAVARHAAAAMTFRAPAGASLAGIDARWSGRRIGEEWGVGLAGGGGRLIAGCRAGGRSGCAFGTRRPTRLVRSLSGRTEVALVARCEDRSGCSRTPLRGRGDRVRARLAAAAVTVELRDTSLPVLDGSGDLFAGGWLRGPRTARLSTTDNVGVRGTSLEVDGVDRATEGHSCDYTRRVPCPRAAADTFRLETGDLADGRHRVALRATDAAGNAGRLERVVRVDNTAPARVGAVRVVGGSREIRSTNSFDLRWSPPGGQAAPIVAARYSLCRVGAPECVEGRHAGAVGGIDDLQVPARGDWRFRVWLEDEAGNAARTNASAPVTLRFDDRAPTLLGAGIERDGRTVRRATVPYGARPLVTGRLTDAKGGRIGGATIEVLARVNGGNVFRRVDTVLTDSAGTFSVRIPSGPSRTVRLAYAGSDRQRPADASVRVGVRARSSLRVSRRHVRNGDRVRFTGRLLGRPLPPEGKLIQLEAFYRNRWRTFAVERTGRGGGWRRYYRFEATTGRLTYPFRVRIPRERSYPYAVGFSRVVRVTVTGR